MIPTWVLEIPGWYRVEDLLFLQQVVSHTNASVVLEVGTHKGRSAFSLAYSLPANGVLYCVDRWEYFEQDGIWLEGRKAYEVFCRGIIEHELGGTVVPVTGKSVDIASTWDKELDVIHLDGLHDSQDLCDDIVAWASKLKNGGYFIGHDWNNPRVREGVSMAVEKGLIGGVQDLCQELSAPTTDLSPASDKRCIWTASSR